MAKYKWNEIVKQAKLMKKNVETEYKMGMNSKWAYYFAKAIMTVNTDVTRISFEETTNPTGDYISNQIYKKDYFDMAKRLIKYVETNKKMPNYVSFSKYKVLPRLVAYAFARILVYYAKNGAFPKYVNVNSKAFTKPTEPSNEVYDYFVKKTGYKPLSLDDILEYVANHFDYEYYYDDQKSNKEVIDERAGNCTDLLQMLVNMTIKLGYDYQVLHVLCSGGDGHVRAKFKHKVNTDNEWVYRDIACVASNGDIYCNWCISGFTLLDINPSWFMDNLNR